MQLKQFIDTSYTAYHTVENVCTILQQNGFEKLTLGDKWNVKVDGKYYVTRNDSSVIAFVIGHNNVFNICESHTDSPSFKVKGNSVKDGVGNLCRINTEKYGGGLLYTYFDRPLKVAGRVVVNTEHGIESHVVTSSYNVVIPSLAIHHNRTANDGIKFDMQNDTLPLLGLGCKDVYSTFGGEVIDADLYVVPCTEMFFAGVNNEFICSPRIDNLTSVYTSVTALCQAKPQDIAIIACLDNEEIGSTTRQGCPAFIDQVLDRLSSALSMDSQQVNYARENGFVLSVDNGHATHPAHPETSDNEYKVLMNNGVVIKHYVNYATDGLTSAIVKTICNNNGVKYQDLYNNSNMTGSSTLGLATARQLGIKACDIGLAQLAMHSACETAGTYDIDEMTKCITAFLSAKLSNDGCIIE